MGRSLSEKRPWIAALLVAFATGLGHLYLRRWRRAFGWVAALFVAAVLFSDPTPSNVVTPSGASDLRSALPILFVGVLSVLDAYVLARAQNASARRSVSIGRDDVSGRKRASCPNCGKDLDPELGFCHWCTTELNRRETPRDGRSGTEKR